MDNHVTKFFDNYDDFMQAGVSLSTFQRTHNIIRGDYLALLQLTEAVSENQKSI